MKRRSVLKAGLASSLIPLLGVSGFAKAFAQQTALKPHAFLTDTRFPASTAFGIKARSMGIPHLASNGDITSIWANHLDPAWRHGKAVVIGLTTQDQLFCLERLAWDRGMRVLVRIEHDDSANGTLQHVISAPTPLTAQVERALQSEELWPMTLAGTLASCTTPLLAGNCSTSSVSNKGNLSERLVTWVIAPRDSSLIGQA